MCNSFKGEIFMSFLKYVLYGIIGIGVVTVSFVAYLVWLQPTFYFPKPAGIYAVGRKTYHWIDSSRKELNAQDPQHPHREIMAYIFYPTKKQSVESFMVYDPDAAKSAMDYLSHASKLPNFLFNNIQFIKTHAQADAPLASSAAPFPVIIFSHGNGGPIVQSYTWMLEELASHGFVVIGINHPYVASTVLYPNGRVVTSKKKRDAQWKLDQLETNAQDFSFVINRLHQLSAANDAFWHSIDVNTIGTLGHSFGGATSLRATRKDKRIACGISLEGGIHGEDVDNPFSTPFMFLIGEKSFLWDKNHPHYPKKEQPDVALSRLIDVSGTDMKIVPIKDAGHALFSDMPLLLNINFFTRFLSRYLDFFIGEPADQATDLLVNTVMPYIVYFFDKHLKGKEFGVFDGKVKT
jgi:dienelactone hydrolase